MFYQKFFNFYTSHLNFATAYQMDFQDPATPVMEAIINFHHDLMFLLILIVIFTSWMLFRCLYFFTESFHPTPTTIVHGTLIEIIWTLTPALILMTVATPSFALLYSMDEVIDPAITIKVIARQWYWRYEYATNELGYDGYNSSLGFDTYLVPETELQVGRLRLLDVDTYLIVPVETHIRLLITASDVLHCWSVPALGIKLDAAPGRMNQTSMYIKRPGTFFGQCSEICGVFHGYMPIVVRAVPMTDYLQWYQSQLWIERYVRRF